MNNFEKIRIETSTMDGMAKLFCSYSWSGTGKVFSQHAGKYLDNIDEAVQAEIKYLNKESKEQ